MSTTEETKNENNASTEQAETVNPCQREISVEIPAEVVADQQNKILANYVKHARVAGFRKGKVPATIVKQRFAEDIQKDLIEQLIPKYFRQETERQKLSPISQPQVTHLELNDGQPLKFTATFEVLPEFEIPGYKDIKVEREQVTVSDEDVEHALKHLQEQQAKFIDVEGESALQDGDYAVISFKGTGVEDGGEPVEMEEVLVPIAGENTIKEFSDNLRGAKPGDERSFDVAYPADFTDQRLAGKTVHYDVKVKGIRQRELPELNDEWAQKMGEEFKSVEDLRTRIREGMEAERRHQAEHKAKDKMIEELVNRYDFPVPQVLVEHQIDQRLDRGLRALAAQGLRQEQLKNMDFGRLREGQREAAAREVKASLLLDKIADAENIEVGEEEIAREVAAVARQMQQTPEAVRARMEQSGGLDRIRERMRNEKALDLLYQQST